MCACGTTITAGVNESAAALDAGTVDLAVLRGDIPFPKSAQTVATLRKNVAALLGATAVRSAPAASAGERARRTRQSRPSAISPASASASSAARPRIITLLNIILGQYGVAPEKVEIVQFGNNDGAEAGRSDKVDATALGRPDQQPRHRRCGRRARRANGTPVFLDIDAAGDNRAATSSFMRRWRSWPRPSARHRRARPRR